MLRIDITSFEAGEAYELNLTPTPEAADLDPETFDDIRAAVRLDVHRDRILVTLTARAQATLTCDRTLRSFAQPVQGSYCVLYGPPHMVGQDGDAFEEVRPLDASAREIDISDVVRDTLLLALPQRKIAPGAEDEDLQMTFAPSEADEPDEASIDPRWEKLRELRDGS